MKKKVVATISTICLSVVLVFGLFATLIANPKTKKIVNNNSFVERYDYVYYASAAEDTGASTASSFYKGVLNDYGTLRKNALKEKLEKEFINT